MNISIIIPNYNGAEILKKNLPKVLEAVEYYLNKNESNVEIIIIDDASTDSSESVISNFKFQISNFKFIRTGKNVGFASTVNRGVVEATGDIVVLLNTDVIPEKDFLIPLVDHFKDDKVFAVGCMDQSIEGLEKILRGRGIGVWKRGFLVHSRGEVDKSNTLWVSGGSGAFRKNIWEKIGGLNPVYSPFYWEDIDLSYRALKAGYKIIFEPKSVVMHEHEKGIIKKKYTQEVVNRVAYRNQIIFVWINASDFTIYISHLLWLPYQLLKAVLKADFSFLYGFFDALILFPKIIKSRLKVQKYFVKKDTDIVSEFIK